MMRMNGIDDAHEVVPKSLLPGYVQKGFFYRCVLKGVSPDLDDLGLISQPPRVALASRVQMPNLPALLLPIEANEFIRVRIAFVDGTGLSFI
ncbi:unnamed protein product [Gongylonema pulchrum]|uniref:Tudor domain-containing protein n=1 Tax=Gongylonema pulchrum TaxID=637853 RepID=A0A183DPS9_9BILA|nr:unnamed protein product [Gongylonema pulchrum]